MANQRALLVGINDYRGISDLRGCINDVTNVRHVLKTYLGFTNAEVRVLVDQRATRDAILSRLRLMVEEARSGDFLVFHFSGHGSQIRDRDGDELDDHMDELICPYDMDWDGVYITDDTLDEVFSSLRAGVSLEVILDCCHSGTGTRDVTLGRPPEEGPMYPTLNRFLPPPIDIVCRFEGEEEHVLGVRRFSASFPRDGSEEPARHVLWSGCRANQTSADAYIADSYNGAFSYYFCKHYRDAGGAITRSELLSRIRSSLSYNGYAQVPQLESETDRETAKVFTPAGG